MPASLQRSLFALTLSAALIGAITTHAADRMASPESVGFSAEGLKAHQQAMRALVDEAKLAGVTTLVARHGKVVAFDAYGLQDLEAKKPISQGHDLPHRVDDQADCRRGDDDALRAGQVDARRSGREAHPAIRQPQGRDAVRRRAAGPADDHAAADEPYGRGSTSTPGTTRSTSPIAISRSRR
jgi:hypothetical protein